MMTPAMGNAEGGWHRLTWAPPASTATRRIRTRPPRTARRRSPIPGRPKDVRHARPKTRWLMSDLTTFSPARLNYFRPTATHQPPSLPTMTRAPAPAFKVLERVESQCHWPQMRTRKNCNQLLKLSNAGQDLGKNWAKLMEVLDEREWGLRVWGERRSGSKSAGIRNLWKIWNKNTCRNPSQAYWPTVTERSQFLI